MTEIVLNERQWAEDAIENKTLGQRPSETLGRVARYFYSMGYKKPAIRAMLEDFILTCDPSIKIARWQNTIDSKVAGAGKVPLVDIPYIVITKKEMDMIGELQGVLLKRIMFTLLCLAKFGNAVNPNNSGWVNRDQKTIFCLANIAVTVKRQALIFNDLWVNGYIGFSAIVDNINVQVKIIDEDGEEALRVSDFRNLGNQYMMYTGEDYFVCENCGIVTKRSGARDKYCKKCAADINIQKTIENRRLKMSIISETV